MGCVPILIALARISGSLFSTKANHSKLGLKLLGERLLHQQSEGQIKEGSYSCIRSMIDNFLSVHHPHFEMKTSDLLDVGALRLGLVRFHSFLDRAKYRRVLGREPLAEGALV